MALNALLSRFVHQRMTTVIFVWFLQLTFRTNCKFYLVPSQLNFVTLLSNTVSCCSTAVLMIENMSFMVHRHHIHPLQKCWLWIDRYKWKQPSKQKITFTRALLLSTHQCLLSPITPIKVTTSDHIGAGSHHRCKLLISIVYLFTRYLCY